VRRCRHARRPQRRGRLSLRFDTIRSIARRAPDSSLATLHDGREVLLSGTSEVGPGHRGIYVDDRRYGRVLISWTPSSASTSAPAAAARLRRVPARAPAHGRVTTRAATASPAGWSSTSTRAKPRDVRRPVRRRGLHHPLRPDRLDRAPWPRRSRRPACHGDPSWRRGAAVGATGDLGERNPGLLIFVDGRQRPEYVPWSDVERIDLERRRRRTRRSTGVRSEHAPRAGSRAERPPDGDDSASNGFESEASKRVDPATVRTPTAPRSDRWRDSPCRAVPPRPRVAGAPPGTLQSALPSRTKTRACCRAAAAAVRVLGRDDDDAILASISVPSRNVPVNVSTRSPVGDAPIALMISWTLNLRVKSRNPSGPASVHPQSSPSKGVATSS